MNVINPNSKGDEGISKFFLGVTLPPKLDKPWEKWRRQFKAPRTPVHLTLVAPFTWEHGLDELKSILQATIGKTKSFPITGCGIGFFGTRVIYIKVDLSKELHNLQNSLVERLETRGVSGESRSFRPHITLATRLDTQQFHQYSQALEGFSPLYSFDCTQVTVFELTKTSGWQKVEVIALV